MNGHRNNSCVAIRDTLRQSITQLMIRRFGKTLLCKTLRCYYEIAEKENFQKLFGDLAIGRDPTALANRFVVLFLDFSRVGAGSGTKFEAVVNATHNAGLVFYVIVDEYDNSTNEIVSSLGKKPYRG